MISFQFLLVEATVWYRFYSRSQLELYEEKTIVQNAYTSMIERVTKYQIAMALGMTALFQCMMQLLLLLSCNDILTFDCGAANFW